MARAIVHLGPARHVVSKLTRCEQLFLARWLQLLYDEVHPRWGLRPLSLGNLSNLYPRTAGSRSKQLLFAIEDEFLGRLSAQEPYLNGVAHPSLHSNEYRQRVRCPTCEAALTAPQICLQERLTDLVEQLIVTIDNDDEQGILAITPTIVSEAVASNVPPRFMMQACRNYVLDPQAKATGSFRERLQDFLRHDVARQPRESLAPPAGKCSVQREFILDLPSAAHIPSRMGTEEVGLLEIERESSARRIWLKRADVDDRLNRREDAAVALRALTPGWLAVLRFCFPDAPVLPESRLEVRPFRPFGKFIDCPGHRRVFSRRQVERAFPGLELLIANDEVRASLYWLSLAYQVWGESTAHAAGMVWMSMESLLGDGGLRECAKTYVDRLQSQLADDIEETLGTLAGDADSRKKGWRAPGWITKLPRRTTASDDKAWLTELDTVARTVCDDAGLRFVLSDAASLASEPAREAVRAQTVIDLRMLQATRHAIAHTGRSIAEEPLMHYLATLGCECIRALLTKRLDGTPHEGSLEGRPILFCECEVVNDHKHPFYIPAWITEGAHATYASAFAESETIYNKVATEDAWQRMIEFTGHRHELTLTSDHRSRLALGECIEIRSTENTGHCHIVRLSAMGAA